MRGHGTYAVDGTLVAAVAGVVERVNKLISVRPLKSRYDGKVGDVIVGRVSEVAQKRWKVAIGGMQDAVLMLSSVNLPGGAQRRKTSEDSLQMRELYRESDLISAEVQSHYADGAMQLQTRSLKYGKLENGQMMTIPPALVKRLKQHFVSLACGVDVILGNNGYVWITSTQDEVEKASATGDEDTKMPHAETLILQRKIHAETQISAETREKMCRVHNAISALVSIFALVHPENITAVYDESVALGLAAHVMLHPRSVEAITAHIAGSDDGPEAMSY